MNDEKTRKWRRRRDARPGELTSAAFELFAERGFAATRLEDVAARTGVSKATIYRYFENKEALFEAVVKEAVAPRFGEAEVLVDAYEGSAEELLKVFFRVVRQALGGQVPSLIKLIISEAGNFPKLAELWADLVVNRALRLIGKIIAHGVARGEFRPVDQESIAPLVASPFLLLAIYKHTLAQTQLHLEPDSVLAAHFDLLLRGLRQEQPSAKTGDQ